MKLFFLPGACSLAPHILINELGLKYDLEKMNKQDKSSILKYNPKGSVPTLVLDDGKVLTEGPAIMQYLADQKPESNLVPKAGTWERYKCQEWLNFVTSELHKGIGVLFNPEFDDNARKILRANVEKKLAFLDEHFSKNQYLMGEQITAPDFYAFVTISWTKHVGIDVTKHTNVVSFLERIKARPATVYSMNAEK